MTVSGKKARNARYILIARKGDTTTFSHILIARKGDTTTFSHEVAVKL